jgi:diguanylate cyclase (GGDEF)-like protein
MSASSLPQELRRKLPSPHGIAIAILEASQSEDTSISDIAELVANDPALSGRLLQLTNSAAMGGAVASIHQAVGRLGMHAVKNLALGFSVVDQHSSGRCAHFPYKKFWSESLLMAHLMRELATAVNLGSADELFTCALLARVGCLGLATAYPVEYAAVLSKPLSDAQLLAQEVSTLGIHHLDISAALLREWGFPELLITPVLLHESPLGFESISVPGMALIARALHVAYCVAKLACTPGTTDLLTCTQLQEFALDLAISTSALDLILQNALTQSMTWAGILQIYLLDFSTLIHQAPSTSGLAPKSESSSTQLRILIVEDDQIIRTLLQTWLKVEVGHSLMSAADGAEALALAQTFMPQIIITDWRMPVMNGLELCRALRQSDWGQDIYVLMLTAANGDDDLVQAFDAGVDDYLTKPLNRKALGARLKAAWRYVHMRETWMRDNERLTRSAAELALSNRRFQLASLTDSLTGIPNRRAGQSVLVQALSAAQRYGVPLCVISIDIDHFKNINDNFGHAAGDEVLHLIGQTLQQAARKEDTVCRWGGEEFFIIAPNISLSEGAIAAERFRQFVEQQTLTLERAVTAVTISLGVACLDLESKSKDQLLIEVDQALYAAKRGGRNRVAVSELGEVRLI